MLVAVRGSACQYVYMYTIFEADSCSPRWLRMMTNLQNQSSLIQLLRKATPTVCVVAVLLFLTVCYAVVSHHHQLLMSILAILVVALTFQVFRQPIKRQLMRIYMNMARNDNTSDKVLYTVENYWRWKSSRDSLFVTLVVVCFKAGGARNKMWWSSYQNH